MRMVSGRVTVVPQAPAAVRALQTVANAIPPPASRHGVPR
jgi:hypothetical protein